MEEKIILALIGLISGVIGSMFAPWANWGIEKRRKKLEHRKELVAKWREMVAEVAAQAGQDAEKFNSIVQNHKDYFSLAPHMKFGIPARELGRIHAELAQKLLWNPHVIYFISEISRLEKEWDLV
jgi:hypothetical protein